MAVALFVGVAAGVVLRGLQPPLLFPSQYCSFDDCAVTAMWKQVGETSELLHMVVTRGGTGNQRTVGWRGSRIAREGIHICPEGVYMDGVKLTEQAGSVVLIYRSEPAQVLVLSPAESQQLKPGQLPTVDRLPFWNKLVNPFVAAAAQPSGEASALPEAQPGDGQPAGGGD